jgi:hypothetical protein
MSCVDDYLLSHVSISAAKNRILELHPDFLHRVAPRPPFVRNRAQKIRSTLLLRCRRRISTCLLFVSASARPANARLDAGREPTTRAVRYSRHSKRSRHEFLIEQHVDGLNYLCLDGVSITGLACGKFPKNRDCLLCTKSSTNTSCHW